MPRLLLFNCSNDLALASNTREYIPPKNVARMESELAVLPVWWCNEGDAVLFPDAASLRAVRAFVETLNIGVLLTSPEEGYDALCRRAATQFLPQPWGWSRAAVERFLRFGVPRKLLPDDENLEELRYFSSKRFAVDYISRFLSVADAEGFSHVFVGRNMRYVTSLDGLQLQRRTVFKSPWSSSGRGVFAADSIGDPSVCEKLCGFLKRQGGFVIDDMYDKRLDFAFEYHVDSGGAVSFIGYSVFIAADNGYYGHNVVAGQDELRQMIVDSGVPGEVLDWLKNRHALLLSETLGGSYSGVLGIDMLVASSAGRAVVHPCIEINLRMNLGIAAIAIAGRRGCAPRMLAPLSLGGFNAKVDDSGRLLVGYV